MGISTVQSTSSSMSPFEATATNSANNHGNSTPPHSSISHPSGRFTNHSNTASAIPLTTSLSAPGTSTTNNAAAAAAAATAANHHSSSNSNNNENITSAHSISFGEVDPATLPSPTMSPITRVDPSGSYFSNSNAATGTLTPSNMHSPRYGTSQHASYMPTMNTNNLASSGSNMMVARSTPHNLMDLPNIAATYEAMPESLKAYLLFQLMRRSALPTLQFVCSYTQQHIRRDFITELPSEVAIHIVSLLDAHSLCRSAQVSKYWRKMVDSDPTVWRNRLLLDGLCETEAEADGNQLRKIEDIDRPDYWYMGGGDPARVLKELEADDLSGDERTWGHGVSSLPAATALTVPNEPVLANGGNMDINVATAALSVEANDHQLQEAQQQQQQDVQEVQEDVQEDAEPQVQEQHEMQHDLEPQVQEQQILELQVQEQHEMQHHLEQQTQEQQILELQAQEEHEMQHDADPRTQDDTEQHEMQHDMEQVQDDHEAQHDLEQHEMQQDLEEQLPVIQNNTNQDQLPLPLPLSIPMTIPLHFNQPAEVNEGVNPADIVPLPQQAVDNANNTDNIDNANNNATITTESIGPVQPSIYEVYNSTTLKERYTNALNAAAGKTGLLPLPDVEDHLLGLQELDGDYSDGSDDELDSKDIKESQDVKKEDNNEEDVLFSVDTNQLEVTRDGDATMQDNNENGDDMMLIDEHESKTKNAVNRSSRQHPLPIYATHAYKRRYRRLFVLKSNWYKGKSRHLTFPAHGSSVVTCLHFDGRRIITGSDDFSVGVWDSATGTLLRHMTGHEGGVWALAVCGDTVVSGSTDRSLRVWDIADGRCTHILWGHTSTVRCCKIIMPRRMANGELCPRKPVVITGSRDMTVRVWWLPSPRRDPPWMGVTENNAAGQINTPQTDPYLLYAWPGHGNSVRAVDGWGRWIVSGSYDCTVRIWDLITGECRWRLLGHTQKVYSVAMMPGGEVCASGSMDGTVRIWRMSDGSCTWHLEGHTSLVGLLDLTPNQLISAAADATLRIWSMDSGRCKTTFYGHTGAITCFQQDGHRILSGSDSTVKLWDLDQGRYIRDVLSGLAGVWQVRFDRRRCVAAVQRNSATWLEVLDFGLGSVNDSIGNTANAHRRARIQHPAVAENVLVSQEGIVSDGADTTGTATTATV
ncbi:hypothetical protein BDF19DRAFT_445482 [Syncephalis fuscata]|nr:hypothetical protein BDF19DRAFT_445482 [Syncephalis fuscata]